MLALVLIGCVGVGAVMERAAAQAVRTEAAKITASDRAADGRFGFSVAGERALVGASGDDGDGAALAGAAYAFELTPRDADDYDDDMVDADEPAPPASLRAAVYSATAAELFWDRPDAFGLVYEVRRDGTPLTTTDGVGHFDDTLVPVTTYTYDVTAIDRDGRRSAPATVTLTTLDDGSGPASPTGLRAAVYSETAAELFWDRPDAFGLVYEVRRDGTPLTTTDGVSHFDDALAAATTYDYHVRAIDRLGRRSTVSTVRLTTLGGDGGAAPDALVAPEIERIAVYSATAAELFWRRPPPQSPVVRVEVSRDNLVLGTTDGTSFFDDTRSPGVDYVYTLVAIDTEGNRSDGGASDAGAGGDGLDTIRPDNAVELLAAVFDAYRGEPWGDIMLALPGFSRTPHPVDLGADEEQTLVCDNDGTVLIRRFFVAAGRSGSDLGLAFAYDDCQDGDKLFDGQVDSYQGRWGGDVVDGTNLAVTDPTGTTRYSGRVFDGRGIPDHQWSTAESMAFEHRGADGSLYSLTGANTDFQYGLPPFVPFVTINLSGGFSIASDRTGGATVRAETLQALRRETFVLGVGPLPVPTDWTFTEGSLRASAADGSTVLLEAANGDEASARLTIIDSSGGRTSFDQPWSVWLANLRFD